MSVLFMPIQLFSSRGSSSQLTLNAALRTIERKSERLGAEWSRAQESSKPEPQGWPETGHAVCAVKSQCWTTTERSANFLSFGCSLCQQEFGKFNQSIWRLCTVQIYIDMQLHVSYSGLKGEQTPRWCYFWQKICLFENQRYREKGKVTE